MAKPFDAATKRLVEAGPAAWLAYVGLQGEQAELVDADLTTITSEADRILRVHNPDYLAHLELQVSYVKEYGDSALRYNLGLRFKRETVISLLKGVQGLKESDTYLMILEEGEARGELNGERKLLVRQGEKRFGTPDAQTLTALEAIDSPEVLMDLGLRLLEVESWTELLG